MFVVLLLVHVILQGDGVPTLTDPPDEVLRYLTDKQGEIQVGTYLQGLAIVAYLWFLGSLWRCLRRAETGPGRLSVVTVAGTAISIALVGIHIAILTGLALRADAGRDPQLVSVLYLVAFVVLGMSAFPIAAVTGAVGALVVRTGVLPRWFGGLSFVATVLWLLAGVAAATDSDAWGAVGFVAFLAWLAWTATASVLLARRASADEVVAGDDGVHTDLVTARQGSST